MKSALAAIVVLLAVLAAPGIARSGGVSMVARDVSLDGRSLAAAQAPMHFNMVGLHWRGSGTVSYRARRLGGGWSPWIGGDADGGPDLRSPEARATRGWRDGNLAWTGASDRIELRTHGTVSRLRAYYVWSRVSRAPVRTTAAAGSPEIVSRRDWHANEKIVRAKPQIAPALKIAIVHHTVNANTYTRAQAPAIVRAIETYHVRGNGWNDIGYNFVIDRYGTIYEGRGGGIDRNVVGAHALGFNYGSVGVALLGTYSRVAPTAAQQRSLVRLLAWRLDVAHVDPLSFPRLISAGNSRFHRGAPVTLRAISGHRDTYFTDCPGNVLYGRLPAIAKAVAGTGLPKIYAPAVESVAPEAVRFTAALSNPLGWTVTVSGAGGRVVGSGSGSGTKVDWTWSGVTTARGPYRWTIEAGGARPASGTIDRPAAPPAGGRVAPPPPPPPAPPPPPLPPTVTPALDLTGLAAAPSVVTPAADGTGASTQVSFSLDEAATVAVEVRDASGFPVLPLQNGPLQAGPQQLDADLGALPDGRYQLAVTATPTGGKAVSAAVDVVVDRTLAGAAVSAPAISPNGDGVLDAATISFSLAASLPVRVEVRRDGFTLATLADGQLGPGPQTFGWDGRDATGSPLPDGGYQVAITVDDDLGEVVVRRPLALDTVPPALDPVDASTLRFRLSEPATVTLLVNGQRVVKVEPAGVFHVPNPQAGVQTVSAQARDAAGNLSRTATWP